MSELLVCNIEIYREEHGWIVIKGDDGGSLRAQTVEANLLFEILRSLKRIEESDT